MLTRYIKNVCSSKALKVKAANLVRDMQDTKSNKKFYGFLAK